MRPPNVMVPMATDRPEPPQAVERTAWSGYEWIAARHPAWQVGDHPEIRHCVTAERRRGNEIRYLVARDATSLITLIEAAEP